MRNLSGRRMNNNNTIAFCILSVIIIAAIEIVGFYHNINSCKICSDIVNEEVFALNGINNGTDYYLYTKGRTLNKTRVHEECHLLVYERYDHFCGVE